MNPAVVILAAGKGTRMRSRLPKVLHPILGRPLLGYVLAAVRTVSQSTPVVVVGHGRELVQAAFPEAARYIVQEEQRGTADAVAAALSALPEDGPVLILYGDMPLLDGAELAGYVRAYREEGLEALVVAARMADPSGYGRVLLDEQGRLVRIVEERDATERERAVTLVNTGVYLTEIGLLRAYLAHVGSDNAQGERYLPDLFSGLAAAGRRVAVQEARRSEDYLGVNDREELARAAAVLRRRILSHWMHEGVSVEDPETTFVGPEVELGPDVVLRPGTHLLGRTLVGEGSRIGPMAHLVDATVGRDAEILASFVEASVVGDRVRLGPFAHLRPGCVIGEEAEVGNYAELKNVRFGARSKAHHHTYLGDAEIGPGVNIGAGAITVNYDGKTKHHTTIAAGGFIGCNANLIAPVVVGEGAYVAAGSTVHQDVPDGALAIGRARQRNILGWVARRFARSGGEERP